jgi:low temperature requirement protein LtrA
VKKIGMRPFDAPPSNAPVTMLELFFDLVFVFVVTQIAGLLGQADDWFAYAEVGMVLLLTWWIYDGFVWLSNNVAPTTTVSRIPMLVAMVCFLAMAASVPDVFGAGAWVFAGAYLVLVVIHTFQFSRSSLGVSSRGIQSIAPVNLSLAGLLLAAAALGPTWGWTGWVAAILAIGAASFLRSNLFTLRAGHFADRHRLLIIIALGETVVAVGGSATGRISEPAVFIALVVAMALISTLWWIYFGLVDDERGVRFVEDAPIEQQASLAVRAYTAWHLLHIVGLILASVALHDILLAPTHPLSWAQAVELAVGIASFLGAQALFRHTLRIDTRRFHVATAALLLAMTPLGLFVSGLIQLASSATVLVCFVMAMQIRQNRESRKGVLPPA